MSHRQIHRSAGCLWFRDDQLLQVIAFHHKEKGKIPYVYKWKNDKTDSSETETQTLYSWSELSLHRKQDSLTKSSRNRSCIDNSKMKLISGVLPLNMLIMRKYQASLSSLFPNIKLSRTNCLSKRPYGVQMCIADAHYQISKFIFLTQSSTSFVLGSYST